MVIGIYITVVINFFAWIGFSHYFKSYEENFVTTTTLYAIGSIIEAFVLTVQVKLLLNFEYTAISIAEALCFTTKNITIFILLKSAICPQLTTYGIALLLGNIVRLMAILYGEYRTFRSVTLNYNLTTIYEEREPVYILSDMKIVCRELTYMSIPKYFLENVAKIYLLYNVASSTDWLGYYTLINHLGGLLVVFVFLPIEQVCYNLFSRLFSDFYIETSTNKVKKVNKKENSTMSPDCVSCNNLKDEEGKKLDSILRNFCTVIKYLIIFDG